MGCVYIFESLRSDKVGAPSYFVYKIGITTREIADRIKGSMTMSANDVRSLYEIDCQNGDEKSWENLLHYVFKGYRVSRNINNKTSRSEWFKVDIKELVKYVELLCKATGVELKPYNVGKNNKSNNSNKKRSNNIKESPTPSYQHYHSLALQLYKLNPNHKIFIQENKINKEGTTGYTKIVDGIYIRTNHDKAGLAKDEKSLTEEISKLSK